MVTTGQMICGLNAGYGVTFVAEGFGIDGLLGTILNFQQSCAGT